MALSFRTITHSATYSNCVISYLSSNGGHALKCIANQNVSASASIIPELCMAMTLCSFLPALIIIDNMLSFYLRPNDLYLIDHRCNSNTISD